MTVRKLSIKTFSDIAISRVIREVIPVFLFSGLTIIAAKIRIPLPWTPVPITLQTIPVLLSGVWLGSIRGSLSQWIYISLGMIGLPVFSSDQVGFSILFSPTAGYLIGFLIAPLLAGWLYRYSHQKWYSSAGILWISSLIIFAFGLSNLIVFHGFSLSKALTVGFYPFIIGDLLKIGFSTSLLQLKKHR